MKKKLLTLFFFCNLISCKPEPKINIEEQKLLPSDKIVEQILKVKIIDSLRMHAFDNLYFGKNSLPKLKNYSLDGSEYVLKETKNSANGLLNFLLLNESHIITREKAINKLENLQTIISKKYGRGYRVSKTVFVKHPEQRPESNSFFVYRNIYNYSTVNIGLPSEYIAYKWNLPFKTIQIGYFVDYKKSHPMIVKNQSYDYYQVYLEITSNIIKEDKPTKNNLNDSEKF